MEDKAFADTTKAEAAKTQVNGRDFHIVGKDGKDFSYDSVSNLPPAGTVFVRKKDGEFFYLASVDGKPGLASLVRRQNGYGLDGVPGLSTLSTGEKERLLGQVSPGDRDKWEQFLSDKAEYARELAKPGKGGGWFEDSRETDKEDLRKSREGLFGNTKPLQARGPSRTPDRRIKPRVYQPA